MILSGFEEFHCPYSLTSDIVIGNCNLGNNIRALRKAHINEILILLQGLLYQLQFCVYMSQKKLFHPGVWQRQELQLAAGKRGTHLIHFDLSPKRTSRNYFYCLKQRFLTSVPQEAQCCAERIFKTCNT